jgi:hypothetical protein
MMNDLYDALKEAIHRYMHMDELNPRKQQKLRDAYSRHVYNYESVDRLSRLDDEEENKES